METQMISDKGEGKWGKVFAAIIIFGLFINVLVLDYLAGKPKSNDEMLSQRLGEVEKKVTDLSAWQAWYSREATGSTEPKPVAKVSLTPTVVPTIIEKERVVERIVKEKVLYSQVKEFYVPLGRAAVASKDFAWVDTGAEVNLDLRRYGIVQEVKFEATLSAPAGQVEVRLYNATDSYPINDSLITGTTWQPTLYQSRALMLPVSAKSYRVQMRTTINQTAIMEGGRIHIVVE